GDVGMQIAASRFAEAFFFQAEDGIRDRTVTGVQTCALPISRVSGGIEMERLVPKKIDMSAHVSDVNVRLQEGAGAIVDGDLTLYGPPLEPVLGGNLVLAQMKYTEDVEIEKSLLDFSRRPPTPKVLTKSP